MMSQLASVGTLVMSGLTVRGESAVAGKWGQTPFSPRLKPHVKMGSDPISHRRHGPLQPVQDFHHGLLSGVDHSCRNGDAIAEAVRSRRARAAARRPERRGRHGIMKGLVGLDRRGTEVVVTGAPRKRLVG